LEQCGQRGPGGPREAHGRREGGRGGEEEDDVSSEEGDYRGKPRVILPVMTLPVVQVQSVPPHTHQAPRPPADGRMAEESTRDNTEIMSRATSASYPIPYHITTGQDRTGTVARSTVAAGGVPSCERWTSLHYMRQHLTDIDSREMRSRDKINHLPGGSNTGQPHEQGQPLWHAVVR
jgi:hypothetical protein